MIWAQTAYAINQKQTSQTTVSCNQGNHSLVKTTKPCFAVLERTRSEVWSRVWLLKLIMYLLLTLLDVTWDVEVGAGGSPNGSGGASGCVHKL